MLNIDRFTKKLYSLRIQILLSFTLLSFISAFLYGILSSFIYSAADDELFNWYMLETSKNIKADNLHTEKGRSFIIGNNNDLHEHLKNQYQLQEPLGKKGLESMKSLDHKEKINDEGTIYEFIFDEKVLQIITIPYEKEKKFLIYDITQLSKIKKEAKDTNDKNILWLILPITLLVTIIGILLGIILSKYIISPISRLANSVQDIELGELTPEITSNNHSDEVDTLAKTIQSLLVKINNSIEHERRFSREVSHELRTPVTSIGIAINLLNSSDLNDQQKKFTGRIERATQDMTTLIKTFLMLGRDTIDQDQKIKMNIKKSIETIIEKNNYLLNNKPVETILIASENEELFVNESLYTVILSNLIRNALQYTHNGSITITANRQKIKITDTGIGMPDRIKAFIGAPYNTNQNSGTGLGLSIVKRIIEKIDWNIEIESKENFGTTITIHLTPDTPKDSNTILL